MFGKELKRVMHDQGINITSLSAKTGMAKSSISQYISEKNEPPDSKKEIIAIALNLPADYFSKLPEDEPKEAPCLTVQAAARLMGKSKEFIYKGLQDKVFPFGWAVKMPSGEWNYYISPVKFTECTGIEVQ